MVPKEKRVVSTSGIFKKYKNHNHNVRSTWKPSKGVKTTGTKKDGRTPKHDLAQDFTENIEKSRFCILENATTSLDSSHHTLTDRLAAITNKSFEGIEGAQLLKEELTRSLDREKLQFEDSSGKPAGVATLGHRMKRFKSLLLTEEGELARLWKEWTDAQQAIIDFSKEVLGPNNLADEEQRRTDQIEAERLKFVEEIENMSKGAIEKMVASEKEMDIRSRKQQKHFLLALHID